MSSSYAPQEDSAAHAPMLRELEALFERHQRDHRIVFPYRTLVHFGRPLVGNSGGIAARQ